MTDDYVVDTNVWVMVDKAIAEVNTTAELDCIETCQKWLQDFINRPADRLVLDNQYMILGEYRDNIKRGRLSDDMLRKLEDQPRNRLIEIPIACDEDGYAIVPDSLVEAEFDPSDRKFVAVALAHDPTPPIINATDSDWEEKSDAIKQCGIVVIECCPDCVAETLANKRK
ncbi:hypothetical protein ACFLYO_08455 [Chloroflexota bacterium]